MSGLGSVEASADGVYLSVAGGYIWNRKEGEKFANGSKNPNFATQEFTRADKTIGTRSGSRYANLAGKIVNVYFKVHDEYGESLNVVIDSGDDRFIVSIATNNRYSQDFMKLLLKADLSKSLFIKPYDFIGKDKKRAQGITFKQDGVKIVLRNEESPSKESEWFKEATKKEVKRFFEDLTDWFVAEVEASVCSQFKDLPKKEKKQVSGLGNPDATEETSQEEIQEDRKEDNNVSKPTVVKVTPMKMRRAVKAYIDENYEGETLPKLDIETLEVWYRLTLRDEELPFNTKDDNDSEVSVDTLDSQLETLLDK